MQNAILNHLGVNKQRSEIFNELNLQHMTSYTLKLTWKLQRIHE